MLSWFSNLQPNKHGQPRCSHIRKLESAIREAKYRREAVTDFIKIQSSWQNLEECAREGCSGCRVFRQAVLLRTITGRQVQKIETRDDPVYARLQMLSDLSSQSTIQVILGVPLKGKSDVVSISLVSDAESTAALPEKRLDLVVPQIRSWLQQCRDRHQSQCGNLAWSRENPRRLLEIISDTEVRLIDSSSLPLVDYVALSYCWGDGGTSANTTWANLESRKLGFVFRNLPATIQDSLTLINRLGLKYLWVDQICIVQPIRDGTKHSDGEDWDLEGQRMHIVYGNAVFTLSAGSSESSTDGLFRPRKAWTYPVVPFYLEGEWLVNIEPSLGNVRVEAPLSKRAWVLQEERLSPRMLYFCGQRTYWSCSVRQYAETQSWAKALTESIAKPPLESKETIEPSNIQQFLALRHVGDKQALHDAWQELIQDYCLRNITLSSDRFRAISGLAAQYLSVFVTKDNTIWSQQYLAGLWRKSFAEDLTWSVDAAVDPSKALTHTAPSWSWASLPLQTSIKFQSDFEPCNDFDLIEELDVDMLDNKAGLGPGALVLEACSKGARQRSVRVRGKLQKIMNSQSFPIPWDETQATGAGTSSYAFAQHVDKHVYARHSESGRLVIHEPNKQAMEAQLDYVAPYEKLDQAKPDHANVVSEGAEKDLYGLEIGWRTMVLLCAVSYAPIITTESKTTSQVTTASTLPVLKYRRVGVCRRFREGFFDGIKPAEFEMI
jgi:hypothetical protein